MRQGKISLARTGQETPLSSSALFFRSMVEPSSLSLTAQLAENSHKIVGKLPYFPPGTHTQVTATSSLAAAQLGAVGQLPRPQAHQQPLDGGSNTTKFLFFSFAF